MQNRIFFLVAGLAILTIPAFSVQSAPMENTSIAALEGKVNIRRDSDGVSHITAHGAHDLFVAQGWQHAADRLFQMDVLRRNASGTLAELLGTDALAQDVELRTVGLRRAAERSLDAVSQETRVALEAYAEGVNAYIAANSLPLEYGALEVTLLEPWTVVDSLAIAKLLSFSLSFDIDIASTITFETYIAAGAVAGFDGNALYFEDTHRSAPFDPAATVPDALVESIAAAAAEISGRGGIEASGVALGHAKNYLKRIEDLPAFNGALHPNRRDRGSNSWVVAGSRTLEGQPLLASDPHLSLTTPATFHPIHLYAPSAGYDVIGDSLPGTPFVLLGQNSQIAWGATTNRMDVTDTYFEAVQVCGPPSGLCTVYQGTPEPLIPVPQTFCYNVFDAVPDTSVCAIPGSVAGGVEIPAVTLISPRRNNGPVVDIDLAAGTALTIQYTGFSGTREADFFRLLNQAASLEDVTDGLRYMDVGAQNFMVATRQGDIAYFTNAEVPLREDLEAGIPVGAPFFIRDGTGGNEWLIDPDPPKDRATPYRIVPFDEMPQVINPPSGVIMNANNDPLGHTLDNNPLNQLRSGGGLFYLAPRWSFATRAGRIRDLLAEKLGGGGMIDFVGMQEIQADVVMLDAQYFVPHIVNAFNSASPPVQLLAADPRIIEAVGRLAAWGGSAPTGIGDGYDASDIDGALVAPDEAEIIDSIAATIYSVWRGRIVANTVDGVLDAIDTAVPVVDLPPLEDELAMTALRHLFDSFDTNLGVGASGLEFFNTPFPADPATRRDFIVLFSLQEALDALAGPDFADAFGNSADQDDYRWGLLHRLTLAHPVGGPFSIPSGGGGFPVDGGFGTVDAATHALRADNAHGFTFADGPVRRYVGEIGHGGQPFDAESSLPGGASGIIGDPFQANLLGRWLTNDGYIVRQRKAEIAADSVETIHLAP